MYFLCTSFLFPLRFLCNPLHFRCVFFVFEILLVPYCIYQTCGCVEKTPVVNKSRLSGSEIEGGVIQRNGVPKFFQNAAGGFQNAAEVSSKRRIGHRGLALEY